MLHNIYIHTLHDIIIINWNSISISIYLVTNIYTDHSMCFDLLLPAFCQFLIYPVANEGSDMVMYLMMYSIYTMKYNSYIILKCKCKTLLESVAFKWITFILE